MTHKIHLFREAMKGEKTSYSCLHVILYQTNSTQTLLPSPPVLDTLDPVFVFDQLVERLDELDFVVVSERANVLSRLLVPSPSRIVQNEVGVVTILVVLARVNGVFLSVKLIIQHADAREVSRHIHRLPIGVLDAERYVVSTTIQAIQ